MTRGNVGQMLVTVAKGDIGPSSARLILRLTKQTKEGVIPVMLLSHAIITNMREDSDHAAAMANLERSSCKQVAQRAELELERWRPKCSKPSNTPQVLHRHDHEI